MCNSNAKPCHVLNLLLKVYSYCQLLASQTAFVASYSYIAFVSDCICCSYSQMQHSQLLLLGNAEKQFFELTSLPSVNICNSSHANMMSWEQQLQCAVGGQRIKSPQKRLGIHYHPPHSGFLSKNSGLANYLQLQGQKKHQPQELFSVVPGYAILSYQKSEKELQAEMIPAFALFLLLCGLINTGLQIFLCLYWLVMCVCSVVC